MNVLFLSPNDPAPWLKALRRHLGEADVFVGGVDDYDRAAIDYACVWKPKPGVLAGLPNLKGIFNLGAGVDALSADATFPRNVPLVRLVDPELSQGMVEYLVHWVLHFHRGFHTYARQQTAQDWTPHAYPAANTRSVGIMGLGELGQNVAHALLMLGFENLSGWSRSKKELPGLKSYAAQADLKPFLESCDILINLLPVTDATKGLINAEILTQLPDGAFFINAGRGETVVDEDLITALKSRRIAAAALDVFNDEPLPRDHTYWGLDNAHITPHIASLTNPMSAAQAVATALRAWEDDETPDNLVDLDQGY